MAARPLGREEQTPEAGAAWSPAEMVQAIRLLGKRSLDAVGDGQVLRVILACSALDRQRPDPFGALWDGLTAPEVERYRERLPECGIGEWMPGGPEPARAALLEVVDDAVAGLRELEREHREREAVHAAIDADRLAFDASDEGESYRRHQARLDRAVLRIERRFRAARRRGHVLTPDPPALRPPGGAGCVPGDR